MFINEIVKSFIKPNEIEPNEETSKVSADNILIDLSNDIYPNSFFDNDTYDASSSFMDAFKKNDIISKQKEKIMKYRNISMMPDINDGLDEIVNEVVFSFNDDMPLKINTDIDNDKLNEVINESFRKITKLTNLKRNLFQIVKRSYIDGILYFHCPYDSKNTKNGITSIKMIEPVNLYFDGKTKTYKYMTNDKSFNMVNTSSANEYSFEEIVREDFGLYDSNVNLSYLEFVLKPANQLRTLEDLLIPLRFSRSISRRVFNVDIGDLPTKRGAEVMRGYQNKFKYKKFYNVETGEVSNQQHVTSMVEDYWFGNRSGGKGTQVDMLDESGNLGELDDIFIEKYIKQ